TEPSCSPGCLPSPLSPLIGREEEVAAVQNRLERARLVTLTGTGGVGKTRLAIQVAQNLADDFPDGAWFVELGATLDPSLTSQAVASVLDLREETDRPLTETLRSHLQPRSLLLVLDNCEHLADACASLAASLLGACAQLKILATSRQALGLPGEVTWRVPSLSLPDIEPPLPAAYD